MIMDMIISDYYDINPEFGTMADLEELIEKAKAKGIKIIMDLVINHSSDEHAWFQEALKDPNSLIMTIISLNPLKMVKNQITGDQFLEVQYGKKLKEEMNIISMLFLKNNLI